MRRILATPFFCAALAIGAFHAAAHPGPNLLTTGNGPQTSMSEGVSYEDVNGVHVFRGRPALIGGEPMTNEGREIRKLKIKITKEKQVRRSFRRMRTQGFYAGDAYPSRRYTQGFYAGQQRGH